MTNSKPKAIIYARFSSDKQRKEGAKSTDTQIRECQAYAEREGWIVAEVFKDEGISGRTTARPGYQAARKRFLDDPEIEVLLLTNTDRLDRRLELSLLVDEIEDKVRFPNKNIVGIDDHFHTGHGDADMQATMHGFQNRQTSKKIASHTYRGQKGCHSDGYHVGGRSYGYDSKLVDPTAKKGSQRYEKFIVSEEADVIREIFDMFTYRDLSARAIAEELNARGVPSPGASWNRNGKKTKDGKWRQSAIYGDPDKGNGILNNHLYNGWYVWNRTHWWIDKKTGARRMVYREPDEWNWKEVPELRIVDPQVWEDTEAKIKVIRMASAKKRAAMKAAGGRRNSYILSGILTCSECGGSFTVSDSRRYTCSRVRDGLCSNKFGISRKKIEPLVIRDIRETLLSEEALELAREEMQRLHKAEMARRKAGTPKNDVLAKLEKVETRIARLRRAITLTDDDIDELADDLKKAQAERKALQAKVGTTRETLSELPDAVFKGLTYYRDQVAAMEDSTGNRAADVEKRALLGQLLGPLVVHPIKDTRQAKELELEYSLNESALPAVLPAGRANAYILVAGAGFEPATFGL